VDSLDFRGVCCYLSFCISDFTDLGLFPPHFIQICQGFVNLVYFFKEPTFCFDDALYGFGFFVFVFVFDFISLISSLIFIISLLLLVLGFA
jgi:hypothetical protein